MSAQSGAALTAAYVLAQPVADQIDWVNTWDDIIATWDQTGADPFGVLSVDQIERVREAVAIVRDRLPHQH